MPKKPSSKPIEIKISTVVAVCAALYDANPATLQAALQQMTGGVADFFDHEFTVIDVAALDDKARAALDWPALIGLLRSVRLNPVAVRNATPGMEAAIIAHGLSLDSEVRPRAEAAPAPKATAAPTAAAQPAAAMIIDTPVRAGQRIYARGDLIVTAAVNNGAEIIADGSIHVYAPLRGRALAGASGNLEARIFALDMEPELVSVAGVYRTFENGFPKELAQRPAQVRLHGDTLEVMAVTFQSRA
jgi:septum site-determining protein MinC